MEPVFLVDNVDKASLDLANDKTYKPWVIDHLVKVRDRLFIMETPEGDPFKPVAILKKMNKIAEENKIEYVLFDKCPKSGRFRKVTEKDMPIILDELAGRAKWGCFTSGHGLQEGGITDAAKKATTMAEQRMVSDHARHSSIKITQDIYNNPSHEQKEDFALVRAGHHPSLPSSNDDYANNNKFLSQQYR